MQRAQKILDILDSLYPDARTALYYRNTFELLIAVILSAQCTDERVNIVTSRLFNKYRTPEDFAGLDENVLAEEIKTCGLFRTKSRNIIKACRLIGEKFNGQVPGREEDLLSLPGVGRKTANVMLSCAFQQDAIAVDTHVFRVAHRLGLAAGRTPEAVEAELQQVIQRSRWSRTHHLLIFHGRRVCRSRKPACDTCGLAVLCPQALKGIGN